jgi:uridine kinase
VLKCPGVGGSSRASPTSQNKSSQNQRQSFCCRADIIGKPPSPAGSRSAFGRCFTYTLELDNYFVARAQTPPGEDGKPDFESLEALHLDKLAGDLERLLAGEEVRVPKYNFETGLPESGELVQLRLGQPIILEGIHGSIPGCYRRTRRSRFKIYVSR